MRTLLFTTGSPYARAVRIVLDELRLDYERRESLSVPVTEQMVGITPTLQVPTLWDGGQTLWDSSLIAEYLLATYQERPDTLPSLARRAFRPDEEWRDRLVFATVQTFGTTTTIISQMTWMGVTVRDNAFLQRSAERLGHILAWLETQVDSTGEGFLPDCLSIHDIFLACFVRFIAARPLGIDLNLPQYKKLDVLLTRLDDRPSFKANPVWWWDWDIVGYEKDGTPIRDEAGKVKN